MTDLLELTLIKQHIRTDRDDEDDYLKVLAGASVEAFQDFTNRTLVVGDTLPEDLVDDEVPMNLTIQQGLLLLIGHWYENREMVTERPLTEIPSATHALWSPYKWYHLGDVEEKYNDAGR